MCLTYTITKQISREDIVSIFTPNALLYNLQNVVGHVWRVNAEIPMLKF